MATKEFTPAELMAAINALGAKTLEELSDMATDTSRSDAANKIEVRLIDPAQTVESIELNESGDEVTVSMSLAESWTDFLFDLSNKFRADFICDTTDKPGRGSGKRLVTKVEIETPDHEVLFVRLTRDA